MSTTQTTSQHRPWWLLPHLLGLDIALLSLCWAHAFACMLEINMYREEPLILLIGSAWLFTMMSRLYQGFRYRKTQGPTFYTEKFALLFVLCLAIALAMVWLLLFSVSSVLLHYLAPFFLYLLVSRLPFVKETPRLLMRSICYAFCCAIPSFYFSVTLAPWDMLSCAPIWYLGVLMFLFFKEHRDRVFLDMSAAPEVRKNVSPHLVPLGQVLLLAICIHDAFSSYSYEQSVSTTLILANACLAVVIRLRKHFSPLVVEVLRLPVMMVAPIISVLIYGH